MAAEIRFCRHSFIMETLFLTGTNLLSSSYYMQFVISHSLVNSVE
jgi:hypothetical protein